MPPRVSDAFFVMMLMTPLTAFGAPTGGSRAPNHLDPFKVFERNIQYIPKHRRRCLHVNAAAVQQHQQLVAELSVEPARADRPSAGVDLGNVDAGHHPQEVRDVRRARATYV